MRISPKEEFTVNEKSGSIHVKQGGLTETFGWNSPVNNLDVNAYDPATKMQTVKATTQRDSQGLPMGAAAAAGASSTWGHYDAFFYEKCENDCVQDVTGQDLLDTIAGGSEHPSLDNLPATPQSDSILNITSTDLGTADTAVVTPIHQPIARGVTNVIAFANYDNKFEEDNKVESQNGSPDFILVSLWMQLPLCGLESKLRTSSMEVLTTMCRIFKYLQLANGQAS